MLYKQTPPVLYLNKEARPFLRETMAKAYAEWSFENDGHSKEEGRTAYNRIYNEVVSELPTWEEISASGFYIANSKGQTLNRTLDPGQYEWGEMSSRTMFYMSEETAELACRRFPKRCGALVFPCDL